MCLCRRRRTRNSAATAGVFSIAAMTLFAVVLPAETLMNSVFAAPPLLPVLPTSVPALEAAIVAVPTTPASSDVS